MQYNLNNPQIIPEFILSAFYPKNTPEYYQLKNSGKYIKISHSKAILFWHKFQYIPEKTFAIITK
jgi:hypothetical protein